jgi:hypothetical protein
MSIAQGAGLGFLVWNDSNDLPVLGVYEAASVTNLAKELDRGRVKRIYCSCEDHNERRATTVLSSSVVIL